MTAIKTDHLTRRWESLTRQVAFGLVFLAPITTIGTQGISLGIVGAAGLSLMILTRGHVTAFKTAPLLMSVWLLAVLTAPVLTSQSLRDPGRDFDGGYGYRILAFFAAGLLLLMLLLWSRRVLGDRLVLVAFGAGSVASAALTPSSWAGDPWKFAFAWPVAVLILAALDKRWGPALLVGLAAVSAVYDFRSFAGLCVVALVLTLWRRRLDPNTSRGILKPVVIVAAVAFGLLQIGSWAALNGHLGEEIQYRTFVQTDGGRVSVLGSARPESAATFSLMRAHPFGLGPGVVPSAQDVDTAKAGLYSVNAATTGGYVDDYMFANRVELHSVGADWWVLFGPLGLLLAVLTLWRLASSMLRDLARGGVTAAAMLVAVVGLWDLFFSPIASNSSHVILALALAFPLANQRKGRSI